MTDIKIRLSGEVAETWITYWMPKILGFDWANQPVGIREFDVISALINDEKACQLALYRTKSQRVAYISCSKAFPTNPPTP